MGELPRASSSSSSSSSFFATSVRRSFGRVAGNNGRRESIITERSMQRYAYLDLGALLSLTETCVVFVSSYEGGEMLDTVTI